MTRHLERRGIRLARSRHEPALRYAAPARIQRKAFVREPALTPVRPLSTSFSRGLYATPANMEAAVFHPCRQCPNGVVGTTKSRNALGSTRPFTSRRDTAPRAGRIRPGTGGSGGSGDPGSPITGSVGADERRSPTGPPRTHCGTRPVARRARDPIRPWARRAPHLDARRDSP